MLLFVALSLALSMFTAQREQLARAIRSTVLRPVLAMQRGVVERNSLFEDPATLRAQRDSMAAFLVGQAPLAAENRHLREMLGLRDRLPWRFVSAEVVRIPERGSEAFFLLTAGARQGVRPGAPIVAAEGLVGLVRDVDEAVAFGLDWTHPEFRASAMTLAGDIYGIVEPRSMSGEQVLLLTGTPRHVDLAAGEMIVTSGQGGVYPTGIPIGVVIGPEEGQDGWQRNYLVRPLVGPSQMNYVLILGDPDPSAEGQDLAGSWGIRLDDPTAAPTDGGVSADPAALAEGPSAGAVTPAGGSVVETPAAPEAGVPVLGTPTVTASPPVVEEPEPARPVPELATPPAAQTPPAEPGPRLLGDPTTPQ